MPAIADLTGQRFGMLVALRRGEARLSHTYWWCRCDCGREKEVALSSLKSGDSQSCGCSTAPEDLTGQRFGRLLVIGPAPSRPRYPKWQCKCSCGRTAVVGGQNLRNGSNVSCGCFRRPHGHASKGGDAISPTYHSWTHMVARCTDSGSDHFAHYGGRGITVCDRWRSFENFLADMGERPPGTSIDRHPNNDGNYEPGNCRWATPREQMNNTRLTRRLTFRGETASVSEWARRTGLSHSGIRNRLARGAAVEAALSAPATPKTEGSRGSRNGAAKLSEAQVLEMRQRYAAGGMSLAQIAVAYGLSSGSAVSAIVNGKRWAHLPVFPKPPRATP
jgi:hypothetical protein